MIRRKDPPAHTSMRAARKRTEKLFISYRRDEAAARVAVDHLSHRGWRLHQDINAQNEFVLSHPDNDSSRIARCFEKTGGAQVVDDGGVQRCRTR